MAKKLTKVQAKALLTISQQRVYRGWIAANMWTSKTNIDGKSIWTDIQDRVMQKLVYLGYAEIKRDRDWEVATITDTGKAALNS